MQSKRTKNRRGFSMMVFVVTLGLVSMAILAAASMFNNQAKRTRMVMQNAQQRQLEMARLLLDEDPVKLPKF